MQNIIKFIGLWSLIHSCYDVGVKHLINFTKFKGLRDLDNFIYLFIIIIYSIMSFPLLYFNFIMI